MRHRRSMLDLINKILEAANGDNGATKTKIMYRAHLKDPQLNKYLPVRSC